MTSGDTADRRRLRVASRARRVAVVVAVALVTALPSLGPAFAPTASAAETPSWSMQNPGGPLAAFNRNDYDEQDGAPQQVASPDVEGRQALEFSLDGGDQRTEVRPRVPEQREGQVQYTAYRAYLAPGFPTDVSSFQVVLQWHHAGDSGSPPVAVEVRGNQVVLASEGADYQNLGPISGGQPIDLVLRIAFSKDPEQGTVDVWNRGRHVLTDFHPSNGTMLDESNYMKVGLYRDTSISDPGKLYLNDLEVGPTMASVTQGPLSTAPEDGDTGSSGTGGGSSSGTSGAAVYVAAGLLAVVGLITYARLRRSRSGR